MLLVTLGASLLGNLLTGKGAIATSQGRGTIRVGEGTFKAGEGTIIIYIFFLLFVASARMTMKSYLKKKNELRN